MSILRHACFIATFTAAAGVNAATIIGGATGDGDFESAGGTGPALYTAHANWFNASGSEGINFSNTSQMGGSSQAGSRGGMPFNGRVQVNNTGHTIGAAGEVFSLSYDFGAGGALANWGGDETMRGFLFTAAAAVDGNLTTGDITEIAADSYDIDRANDGQWTTRSIPVLYTSTGADVGNTVYFGMEFVDAGGNTLFPRIDVVNLSVEAGVIPEPSSLVACSLLVAGLVGAGRRR
ncbi:hypothetical protein MalM25_20020 [Planctomycetes bacterium MalM25]|nr:hypothetical protein MalM25_20020 [Planctomycetes bacterium MalM25]